MKSSVYLSIDEVWSYNFIGGIDEISDLRDVDKLELYLLACEFIKLQYNFVKDYDNLTYNTGMHNLNNKVGMHQIDSTYILHYYRDLYSTLEIALGTLPGLILNIKPSIGNDNLEMIGLIIEVRS